MIYYTRRGARVAIRAQMESCSQKLQKGQQGTVLCEYENNVGRTLVACEWDTLGQFPVFPEEIIFLDTQEEQ